MIGNLTEKIPIKKIHSIFEAINILDTTLLLNKETTTLLLIFTIEVIQVQYSLME